MPDYRAQMQKDFINLCNILSTWDKTLQVGDLNKFSINKRTTAWEFDNKESGIIFKGFDNEIISLPKLESFEDNFNSKIRISFDNCKGEEKSLCVYDHFISLNVNIEIEITDWALDENGEWEAPLKAAWHLDKNIDTFVDSTNFIHPEYHFHFGGMRMEHTFNQEHVKPRYSGILILDAPRLQHPPLDPILAIDFVIKNFYKYKTHCSITDQKSYNDIIANAQNRFWKPYYLAIAKHWINIPTNTCDFDTAEWSDRDKNLAIKLIPFLNGSLQSTLNN